MRFPKFQGIIFAIEPGRLLAIIRHRGSLKVPAVGVAIPIGWPIPQRASVRQPS
jgi:hypothetical protein